ncbi:RNA polymerase subunit sigma-70 [Rhodobacterales bacterium 52_120_T64]|nr:RNA polymerase subunit sigma-70 [Rhodobacterales bacterium 52_120_T64]
METSDERLVAMAADGDGGAFRSLLQRHYATIFRIGFRVLGDREDAEDLAQDICAVLPKKLTSFKGHARFTTWLHQIVINGARDVIRRKQSARHKASGWGATEVLRRDEAIETKADLDWLSNAMKAMPQDLRETVALVLGEDMTHREAAKVLDLSEGTISWRMSEVKKILREIAIQEEML